MSSSWEQLFSLQRSHFGACQYVTAPYSPAQMFLCNKKRVGSFKQRQNAVVCSTFSSFAQSCSLSCSSCVFQGVVMSTKSVWMCVCVCWPRFSLFASGLGMKGPGGSVREALADVSWPVGTWFSRIRSPSQAGFGSTLTRSRSVSCLYLPSPFFP